MYGTVARLCFKKTVKICAVNGFHVPRLSYTTEANVIKSKWPDIQIPSMLFDEYIWRGLDKWHDKTALVCAETGRSYKYSEMHRRSLALANFLNKFYKHAQNETNIAIVLPNVPEYPIIMLGIIQAGFTATTINPLYTADEIKQQLSDSEAKMVFTLTESWPKINQAVKMLNSDVKVVVVSEQQTEAVPPGAIKFKEITEGDHTHQFKITRSVHDVIVLPYSSGTTGVPKGVELTHKTIVSNLFQQSEDDIKLHEEAEGSYQDITASVLPFFHIYGMVMTLFHLVASGCKLVTVPRFGSQIFLEVLETHRPTLAYLAPPIVLLLLNNPHVKPDHISQIRSIVCGAAPLGAADIERLYKKTDGKVNFLQAYGMTEASPLTHMQTPVLSSGVKLGGIGFALPNTECKIVSLDDQTKTGIGPNQSGELLIRGPQIMKGYYKNPEATQNVLDTCGWLRTGDIGHYDEDGHFFITDRLKELIKVKGFQVAPAELEELLRDHPDVDDAAVVGVPHAVYGEVPKAFVIAKTNIKPSSASIQEYVKSKVADYKQLTGGVVLVNEIPKTPSGKILRRELKKL